MGRLRGSLSHYKQEAPPDRAMAAEDVASAPHAPGRAGGSQGKAEAPVAHGHRPVSEPTRALPRGRLPFMLPKDASTEDLLCASSVKHTVSIFWACPSGSGREQRPRRGPGGQGGRRFGFCPCWP